MKLDRLSSDELTEAEVEDYFNRLRGSSKIHQKTLEKIESRLGLAPGFFRELIDEKDDWAFIIKVTVVLDFALGDLICNSLIIYNIDRHVRSLSMDGRVGKIQLAKDLELLSAQNVARLRQIFLIRNDFAHGLETIKLSLSEYFARMSEADFDALIKILFSREQSEGGGAKRYKKINSSDPKKRDGRLGRFFIWTGACIALLEISRAQKRIASEHSWRDAVSKLGHAFLARQQGNETLAREHIRGALDQLETISAGPLISGKT